MKISIPKEIHDGEKRVATTPEAAAQIIKLGFSVSIESGAGVAADISDDAYRAVGVEIVKTAKTLWKNADIILKVRAPEGIELDLMPNAKTLICFIWPAQNPELMGYLAKKEVTVLAMDSVPRMSRAQKLDALSSMANIAGYRAVIEAAQHFGRFFTGQITAAGKIPPAKILVIGAGVAGLQAIATAKRLGARVEAFDTRPVVAEQVRSLGAKFVEIDLGEIGQTEQGYAKELTKEQLDKQREGQKKVIAQSDIVITTAQVFGRPAPRIVSRDMVEGMQPGSIVVDMAVESGGNVEGSVAGQIVDINGVKVLGISNLPSEVARNASDMYSANLLNLIDEFWDGEKKSLDLDPADDIVKGCVITRDGQIVNQTIANHYTR